MSPPNQLQPSSCRPQGKFYQLAYSCFSKGEWIRMFNERLDPAPAEALCVNRTRDGRAFAELAPALSETRAPGCAVMLYPPLPTPERLAGGEKFVLKTYRRDFTVPMALMGSYPKFHPGDVLVLVTRPPLTDDLDRDRKVVLPSLCPMEEDMFAALRKIFRSLSRSIIELQDEFIAHFPTDRREMANLVFDIHRTGRIREYRLNGCAFRPVPEDSKRSVGYFIHLPRLSERFPVPVIISFGVRGYETEMWNRKVRMQKPEWLERPVFAMAEMNLPYSNADVRSKFPICSDLADGCRMEVLIEHWLDGGKAAVATPKRRAA